MIQDPAEDEKKKFVDPLGRGSAMLVDAFSQLLAPDDRRNVFRGVLGIALAAEVAAAWQSVDWLTRGLYISAGLVVWVGCLWISWRFHASELKSKYGELEVTSGEWPLPAHPGHPGRVCVVCPDPTHDPTNADQAYYEDGKVQLDGFRNARKHALGFGIEDGEILWCGIEADKEGAEILKKMKTYYAAGATFFVMTMTGKISSIRDEFMRWREQCALHRSPPPVLIATVASAPNLADVDKGIVRWYVRSQEESDKLAAYLHKEWDVKFTAAFLVGGVDKTHHHSPYATEAARAFQEYKHFEKAHRCSSRLVVPAASVIEEVGRWVDKWKGWSQNEKKKTGVFVAGYGRVIGTTIEALRDFGFDGPIACTSTLTNPEWQPKGLSHYDKIVTVLPMTKGGGPLDVGYNVVFRFAKNSLLRVLFMRRDSNDPVKFLKRWMDGNFPSAIDSQVDDLSEVVLPCGDVMINVEAVTADRWRS